MRDVTIYHCTRTISIKARFYPLDKAGQIITSGNIPKKNCLNYLFLQQSLYGAFYVNAHHDRNLQKLSQTFFWQNSLRLIRKSVRHQFHISTCLLDLVALLVVVLCGFVQKSVISYSQGQGGEPGYSPLGPALVFLKVL